MSASGEVELTIQAEGKGTILCYRSVMSTSGGIWLGDNPLHFSLPLLLFQITIIFLTTRLTHAILRGLGLPLVISQVIGGIILGPYVIGRNKSFARVMFSPKGREQLNTISFISFMIFLFLVGIKTDASIIKKSGKKAIGVALIGIILPVILAMLVTLSFNFTDKLLFYFYIASRASISSYTVVSCVLQELNLLSSNLGRLALSASLMNEFFNYFSTAVLICVSVANQTQSPLLGIKSLAALIILLLFITYIVRPGIIWMIRRTPEGRMLDEWTFLSIMFVAFACGLLTEVIGHRATMGPFYLGLILPGGPPLGITMVERLERLVCGVFLPVMMAIAGLRMDLGKLVEVGEWGMLEMIVLICIAGKFIGVVSPCLYCRMPWRDAFFLSLMMNSKGIYEIDIANVWLDSQILNKRQHSMILFNVLVFGGTTAPLLKFLYRPEDRFIANKRRTLQHSNPSDELRVLACVHSQDHVNPIVSLLDLSTPSSDHPLCLYILHLTPLAGRSAALLLPYNKRPTSSLSSIFTTESDHIFKAFLYLQQQFSGTVSVLPYVGISPHATMHDYVCTLALDKKATLIILPFHRRITIDGTVEAVASTVQAVNINVLRYAPCSVGMLVNQGESKGLLAEKVVVFFLGGADDREALAYGVRMGMNPRVEVVVVRIRLQRGWEMEEKVDDEVVEEFRRKGRVEYREEVVRDSSGTAKVIKEMSKEFGLVVVGRREGVVSALTEGLDMWSEYPELGAVGDMLATSDLGGIVATLVVQQQRRVGGHGNVGNNVSLGSRRMVKERGEDDDDDDD
ncbi:cation/H(+) antiporter 15-like [Dioscorea cayenensis subsp. rotundata]|uniref:Cation/H(+) antiporter 15-like n=1 Tax=Dioscorea cayennensis subsp. rotundata TaxID=55577 RepID=A0AB40CDG5_DIOCR|nr:cation/H(+) antiporter 15-like [Dioscorea cayenensis subsp. rotundata]